MRATIRFTGNLAVQAGISEIKVGMPEDVNSRLYAVKREIEDRIGNTMLYTVLLNGRALQTYTNPESEITDDVMFTVVPVTIGG